MGIDPVTIQIASLAFSAFSVMQQGDAQDEARANQERSNEEQKKIRDEQKAGQAAQAAAERRQQLREERIKRARLIQSGQNTGTAGSSGVAGASGGLQTQLQSNIGFNLGQLQNASNISQFGQNSADFLSSANNSIVDANQWGAAAGMGMNIFKASGGFNNIFGGTQAGAPVSDANVTPADLYSQYQP